MLVTFSFASKVAPANGAMRGSTDINSNKMVRPKYVFTDPADVVILITPRYTRPSIDWNIYKLGCIIQIKYSYLGV